MGNITPILENSLPRDFVGAGTVTSMKEGAPYCAVRVPLQSGNREVLAAVAYGLDCRPAVGDRVMCLSGDDDTVYITMILERRERSRIEPGVLTTNGKAEARVLSKNDQEILAVYDRSGELIFEYDPENDRSRVLVKSGDIDLAAPEGDINFSSGGRIRFDARSVEVTASGNGGVEQSRLSLGQLKTELQSAHLDIKSSKNSFELDDVNYRGKKLASRVSRAKLNWGRVESLVDTLVQKARASFTTVEELSQTRAGRMRTLVSGSFHLRAERAKLKTDKTVDIDGERINLG